MIEYEYNFKVEDIEKFWKIAKSTDMSLFLRQCKIESFMKIDTTEK